MQGVGFEYKNINFYILGWLVGLIDFLYESLELRPGLVRQVDATMTKLLFRSVTHKPKKKHLKGLSYEIDFENVDEN
jgi:hypothetical protein